MNIVKMITLALIISLILVMVPFGVAVVLDKALMQFTTLSPAIAGAIGIAMLVVLVLALMGYVSTSIKRGV